MARISGMVPTLGLLLLAASHMAAALDFDLCSSFNTAETARNISRFQSNGLCHDFCISEYAYAVTQWTSCWCTNYTPDQDVQVSDNRCSQDCPGWPDEKCGGDNVFAYLLLNNVLPSGTRGPETEEPTSTRQSEASSTARTTTTEPPDDLLPTSSFVQTVSYGSTVVTVTVTPPEATSGGGGDGDDDGGPSDNANAGTTNRDGLGTGAIVGIVIGVIAAVLITAGLVLFWFFRRRRRNQQDEGFRDDPSVKGSTSPGVLSPNLRSEMGMAACTPLSPASATRRNSTLQIDPRMDPFKKGLYTRSHSQESVNTIHDDRDYSRRIQQPKVLRATNPDPAND
ncbi:hypothetical protein S7711_02783 [Stachybotrys chartarum IBT 7711]|uniref:WSC domain-containing protein n=1 Tax=Stachybotrys chartarum (strain CBS 109288 / IBT 7711) TaxID=1280523 RepID=A0A084ALZ2_STACB|nr:hypothetical protein S7711_02783 [Stachybotrys chartarum IBT 7711]KFA49932.1 hypothetical protein S40293_01244 [Stachybotrys chartarum IBT 40293]